MLEGRIETYIIRDPPEQIKDMEVRFSKTCFFQGGKHKFGRSKKTKDDSKGRKRKKRKGIEVKWDEKRGGYQKKIP